MSDKPPSQKTLLNENSLGDVVKIMVNTPPISNEELIKRREKGGK